MHIHISLTCFFLILTKTTNKEIKRCKIEILECNILNIQANSGFNMIYIYHSKNHMKHLYYFNEESVKKELNKDGKNNYILKDSSNMTHITLNATYKTFDIYLEIEVVSEGIIISPIIKTHLIFDEDLDCFIETPSGIYIAGPSEVIEGRGVTYTCKSIFSSLTYTWYKYDQLLTLQNILQFKSIKKRDEGEYYCQNDMKKSPIFQISVYKQPMFHLSQPELLFIGDNASLTCEINSSIPYSKLSLIWLKNDKGVIGTIKHTTEFTSSFLKFTNIQIQDAGQYRCKAIISMRPPLEYSSNPVNMPVYGEPKLSLRKPNPCMEGDNLSLTCEIIHNIPIQKMGIKWFNNTQIINGMETSVLHFVNVSRFYQGKYGCRLIIWGRKKEYHQEVQVEVHYRPSCTSRKKYYKIVINDSERINCDYDANPEVTSVSWYRDSISESNKLDNTPSITITASYNETYICSATNERFPNVTRTCLFNITVINSSMNKEKETIVERVMISDKAIISVAVIILIIIAIVIVARQYKTRSNRTGDIEQINMGKITKAFRKRPMSIDSIRIHVNKSMYQEIDSQRIPSLAVRPFQLLGTGNFGEVYQAELINDVTVSGTYHFVALKIFKDELNDPRMRKQFEEELKLHYKVSLHKHVIKCLGKTEWNGKIGMVMEFSTHGTLKSLLRNMFLNSLRTLCKSTEQNSEDLNFKCMKFAREIAFGMEHIAKFKVVHRDLAARNILLGDKFECKIADFGLSRLVTCNDEYQMASTDPLPIRWLSPEALSSRIFTEKSDIWSYGVVLWEIASLGGVPYSNIKNGYEVKNSVISGYRMPRLKHCNDELYTIMNLCWESFPDDRPNFSQLVKMLEHMLEHSRDYLNFNIYEAVVYEDMDTDVYREEVSSSC